MKTDDEKKTYESLSGDNKRVTLGELITEYIEFYLIFFGLLLAIPIALLVFGLYLTFS